MKVTNIYRTHFWLLWYKRKKTLRGVVHYVLVTGHPGSVYLSYIITVRNFG